MTYALSAKSYSCWDCKHFLAIDPLTRVDGYCRRHAPCSLDLYGYLLSARGDILSHNGTNVEVLSVGTIDQVMVADPLSPVGISWQSLVTTRGDLMSHNGSAHQRLPVGTDGQMLIADSAETVGLRWTNQVNLALWQVGRLEVGGVTGGDAFVRRSGAGLPISDSTRTYISGTMEPLPILLTDSVVAVQYSISAQAVAGTGTPIDTYLKLDFYQINNATETSLASISIPIPAAMVDDADDLTSTTHFVNGIYYLPVPISGVSTGLFGFRMDLSVSDLSQISAVLNPDFTVYVKTNPYLIPDIFLSMAIKKEPEEEEVNIHLDTEQSLSDDDDEMDRLKKLAYPTEESLFDKERNGHPQLDIIPPQHYELTEVDEEMAHLMKLAYPSEDAPSILSSPIVRAIDPSALTSAQSLSKWCLIRIGPNEWCGEYERSNETIPDIPTFVYPEP